MNSFQKLKMQFILIVVNFAHRLLLPFVFAVLFKPSVIVLLILRFA